MAGHEEHEDSKRSPPNASATEGEIEMFDLHDSSPKANDVPVVLPTDVAHSKKHGTVKPKGLSTKSLTATAKRPCDKAAKQDPSTRRTSRRRKTGYDEHTIGSGKSFSKIENLEATVAAYCGFDDVGKFREFYTSVWVTLYYLMFLKYRKQLQRRTISILDNAPYEGYWATDDDPSQVYPPDEDFLNAAEQASV